ncbi:MAG: CapA family protein, partial [Nitrosospira sp.]
MTKPENTRCINQQLARREFIGYALAAGVAMACRPIRAQTATSHSTGVNVEAGAPEKGDKQNASGAPLPASNLLTLFLCGDVMTGRGVDQVLPHAGNPILYEQYMKSATGYLELAEEANGSIPKPVEYSYIWGDALAELERVKPDVRIINLETAVTRSDEVEKDKSVNYRMHPDNIPCITAANV